MIAVKRNAHICLNKSEVNRRRRLVLYGIPKPSRQVLTPFSCRFHRCAWVCRKLLLLMLLLKCVIDSLYWSFSRSSLSPCCGLCWWWGRRRLPERITCGDSISHTLFSCLDKVPITIVNLTRFWIHSRFWAGDICMFLVVPIHNLPSPRVELQTQTPLQRRTDISGNCGGLALTN